MEYALTTMGQDLLPLIDHMREYGTKWLATGDEASPATPGHTKQGA
ncbi:MAG: winged helix-turn-helix transcriptional regulator [Thermoleophilia bacterium]